jgi:4-hydroxy-3-methylbut-2-en-1-yl diphosphate reductase
MIGHKGHPEVEGTMGQLTAASTWWKTWPTWPGAARASDKLAVVTQTTLSVDDAAEILAEVKRAFRTCASPSKQDICYATQNRQDAVKLMAPAVDVVVVVGSPTSSNSNRLRELAERLGTEAYMVEGAEICARVVRGPRRVGLTAGASAPDILVQQVIARLRELGALSIRKMDGVQEDVHFPLPRGLGDRSMARLRRAILTERPLPWRGRRSPAPSCHPRHAVAVPDIPEIPEIPALGQERRPGPPNTRSREPP